MAELGDLIAAFGPQPWRRFRMVQSRQLQAMYCRKERDWKGICRDRSEKSWYVEAGREHEPKPSRDEWDEHAVPARSDDVSG